MARRLRPSGCGAGLDLRALVGWVEPCETHHACDGFRCTRPILPMSRLMSFPAPFDRYQGEVRPEWIDHNGHMNLAYYTVLFDYATDQMFDVLDLGLAYRRRTELGTFVTETHNRYERELLVGDQVRVTIQILLADDKRLHLAHEMFRLDNGE